LRILALAILCAPCLAVAAPEPLNGDVLVWNDATYFVEPREGAISVKVGALGGAARADRVGAVTPMHVVAVTGDFVEVTPADSECVATHLVAGSLARLTPIQSTPATVRLCAPASQAKHAKAVTPSPGSSSTGPGAGLDDSRRPKSP
jgi:hypothetical protein